MTQYIDKAAIIAEIERLREEYASSPTRNIYEDGLKEGRLIGYRDALHKINTLEAKEVQEEPVSEELEEVAEEWDESLYRSDAFKAGAKWQEKQMIVKAVDGYVIEDIEEGNGDFLLSADYLPKSIGLKDQQKVKVIVIKED